MREILDASSQRMIKILEILLEHEDWITFTNLSILAKASERTVSNDIALLKDLWGDNLSIDITLSWIYQHLFLIYYFGYVWLHTQFLVQVLSNFFNNKKLNFYLKTATYPDILLSKNIDHYDIIITTIPNLPFSHKNVVLINDYPTSDDFCKIHKAV